MAVDEVGKYLSIYLYLLSLALPHIRSHYCAVIIMDVLRRTVDGNICESARCESHDVRRCGVRMRAVASFVPVTTLHQRVANREHGWGEGVAVGMWGSPWYIQLGLTFDMCLSSESFYACVGIDTSTSTHSD
jgi:hypothetical protein